MVSLVALCSKVAAWCASQAKKQQEKEAAKAQQKAERQHQKELRRAKAMALAQGGAQVKKEPVQEGELPPAILACTRESIGIRWRV